MAEEALASEQLKIAIGRRIKALRRQRHLTLENVSGATRLSKSLLSQIENGNISPSVANLLKISRVLRVDIAYFFQQRDPTEEFELIRAAKRKRVRPTHSDPESLGYSHDHLISFVPEGTVEVFAVEIEVLTEKEMKFNTHPGMELVFVLDGDIEFLAEEGFRVILHAGDVFRFPAKYPHAYRGMDKKARVVAMFYSSPGQRLEDWSKASEEMVNAPSDKTQSSA